jgi:hypothetical protein
MASLPDLSAAYIKIAFYKVQSVGWYNRCSYEAQTHGFSKSQITICCRWYGGVWIDFGELLALVLSSEVIDVVLMVVGFHLVQSSEDLTRVDRAWVA